jgi:hypothetical protein
MIGQPGLKLNVMIDDDSFIGEVYFYDESKQLLILSKILITRGIFPRIWQI